MPKARRLVRTLFLLLNFGGLLIGEISSAHSEESTYGHVGWWTILYKDSNGVNGCSAISRFTDQTLVEFFLLQDNAGKGWGIALSSPRWDSWVSRKSEHPLWFKTAKGWRGIFKLASDNKTLFFEGASIEFMNSIADAQSLMIFNEEQRPLTRSPLSMKDSGDAIRAVVNCVREHPFPAPAPQARAPTTQPRIEAISGTGFYVAPGLLVTNNHVVKDCSQSVEVRYPDRNWYPATIYGQDQANDLTLLHTDMPNLGIAGFHLQSRLGDSVATYGFPYAGVLSSSGNFTLGNITSLTGIGDDTRFLQISTPVQPGNSGGPLLDMFGSVVGVVVAQLDALSAMQAENSIPQNVNFAIQVPIVINFLSIKGVTPRIDTLPPARTLSTADLADLARQFTVQIYCQARPPNTSQSSNTPTTTGMIEEQARNFVLSLQAKWSRPNEEALAGLDRIYDDQVMYFGKTKTKDEVIKDIQAFARKFSEREYKPRQPLEASCDSHICSVRGILDFQSIDPVERKVSRGVATFEYQLLYVVNVAFKIRLENGEVLTREVTPLSSASPQASDGSRVSNPLYSREKWMFSK